MACNPLVATEFQDRIKTDVHHDVSVSNHMAFLLHKRGLDEDAAQKIANAFVDGHEELYAQMIDNLVPVLSQAETLEYLSNMALHRKEVRLDSYDHLLSMVTKIKKRSLDKNLLAYLQIVAKRNSQLVG